mmetsp:Transcript_2861/g.9627  ORF Transcript_2861/g.9627 Transcript_2861/m.9627 type:complete len:206 (+) Transcript_2861:708-1325(+)
MLKQLLARPSTLLLFVQANGHELVELSGVLRSRRRRVLVEDGEDKVEVFHVRSNVVGIFSENALSRYQANGPHVSREGVALALHPLWGHVDGGSCKRLRLRHSIVHGSRNPKVRELDDTRGVEEDVARLQVTMNVVSLLVEEVKALQDLTGDDRNNFLCRLGAALQSCIKTSRVHQFHRYVHHWVAPKRVVELNKIGADPPALSA